MAFADLPREPITADQALDVFRDFIRERSEAGVMMADAFHDLHLDGRTLVATWSEDVIGREKSKLLLGLNPFEDLAAFIGTPMMFNNEQGRQLRQHVDAVSVIGPFGVGGMSAQQLYERGTGEPA